MLTLTNTPYTEALRKSATDTVVYITRHTRMVLHAGKVLCCSGNPPIDLGGESDVDEPVKRYRVVDAARLDEGLRTCDAMMEDTRDGAYASTQRGRRWLRQSGFEE